MEVKMGRSLRRPPRALAAVEAPQGGKEVREMEGIVIEGTEVRDGMLSVSEGSEGTEMVGVVSDGMERVGVLRVKKGTEGRDSEVLRREERSTLRDGVESESERLIVGVDRDGMLGVERDRLMLGVESGGTLGVESVRLNVGVDRDGLIDGAGRLGVDRDGSMLGRRPEDVVIPTEEWSVKDIEELMLEVGSVVSEDGPVEEEGVGVRLPEGGGLDVEKGAMGIDDEEVKLKSIEAIELGDEGTISSDVLGTALLKAAELVEEEEVT